MKSLKYLMLLFASVAVLAACGTTEEDANDDAQPAPTTGTLVVETNESATVTVSGDGLDAPVTQTVDAEYSWSLDAGTYTVEAEKEGYTTASPTKTATVVAGQQETVEFAFVPNNSIDGNPDTIEIVSMKDIHGIDYNVVTDPSSGNTDSQKRVIVAAQTQDDVCVTIRVLDDQGQPVTGAPVYPDFGSADFDPNVQPGCALVAADTSTSAITTDENGEAEFTVTAFDGFGPTPTATDVDMGTLNGSQNLDSEATPFTSTEPVAVEVDVTGEDQSRGLEFRMWAVDMTHLQMVTATRAGSQPEYEQYEAETTRVATNPDEFEYTERYFASQRMGGELGEVSIEGADRGSFEGPIRTIFDDTNPLANEFHFETVADLETETTDPFQVGYGLASYGGSNFENGFYNVSIAPDNTLELEELDLTASSNYEIGYAGFMQYTLSGDMTDMVEFDGCYTVSIDGTVCIDENIEGNDAAGVTIKPTADVTVDDLPLSVDVEATYHLTVNFSDELHHIPFKNYAFTKEWIGGYLTLDKYADQHVLTWAGGVSPNDVTLPANDAKTVTTTDRSTYTIVVTNPSTFNVSETNVVDLVPPELGVVTSTITSTDGSASYDDATHAIEWDLGTVSSTESETLEFDVYVRHKPGYVLDVTKDGNVVSGTSIQLSRFSGEVSSTGFAYQDPYAVANGFNPETLTATAVLNADTGVTETVATFAPEADEADIAAVRPLFELDLFRSSGEPVIRINDTTNFKAILRSIDRASTTTDPDNTAYKALAEKYPWEFGGTLSQGNGHKAPTSEERTNPYAYDISVDVDAPTGLTSIGTAPVSNVDLIPNDQVDGTFTFRGDAASTILLEDGTISTTNVSTSDVVSDVDAVVSTVDEDVYAYLVTGEITGDQVNQPSTTDDDHVAVASEPGIDVDLLNELSGTDADFSPTDFGNDYDMFEMTNPDAGSTFVYAAQVWNRDGEATLEGTVATLRMENSTSASWPTSVAEYKIYRVDRDGPSAVQLSGTDVNVDLSTGGNVNEVKVDFLDERLMPDDMFVIAFEATAGSASTSGTLELSVEVDNPPSDAANNPFIGSEVTEPQ